MLELTHNGVVTIDAVCKWYAAQSHLTEPFNEWWGSLSSEDKRQVVLQVLISTFGEVFHREHLTS